MALQLEPLLELGELLLGRAQLPAQRDRRLHLGRSQLAERPVVEPSRDGRELDRRDEVGHDDEGRALPLAGLHLHFAVDELVAQESPLGPADQVVLLRHLDARVEPPAERALARPEADHRRIQPDGRGIDVRLRAVGEGRAGCAAAGSGRAGEVEATHRPPAQEVGHVLLLHHGLDREDADAPLGRDVFVEQSSRIGRGVEPRKAQLAQPGHELRSQVVSRGVACDLGDVVADHPVHRRGLDPECERHHPTDLLGRVGLGRASVADPQLFRSRADDVGVGRAQLAEPF